MTMTDSSPPLSPVSKSDEHQDPLITQSTSTHPTLPQSAVNKSLYYHFPTPPHSPLSPTLSNAVPRIASPRISPAGARRPKHTRNASRSPTHTRRRSSLSTSFLAGSFPDYGPPPHPAPTTPLPPVPGAPRIPYTTPQQERNRYSSYELIDKLLQLERQQQAQEHKKKRYSAPPLRQERSLPLAMAPTTPLDIRRTYSDTAATENAPQIPSSRHRRTDVDNEKRGQDVETRREDI